MKKEFSHLFWTKCLCPPKIHLLKSLPTNDGTVSPPKARLPFLKFQLLLVVNCSPEAVNFPTHQKVSSHLSPRYNAMPVTTLHLTFSSSRIITRM